MSQHGCPERLSNRSKGFQEDGPSQPTMEVLVETLTGTAFEMTVSPSDTVFAIKSKIFRVEGIPISQQHLLYKLQELEDSSSLGSHAIGDGARLRLVLGMRGGPISTRRLPPPPAPSHPEPWPDIERLLDSNREESEPWSGGSGCKVTVLVFRDGERVNMLRVRENNDGTYSPLDHNKYSSLSQLAETTPAGAGGAGAAGAAGAGAGSLQENALTHNKMLDIRRRMETLSLQRRSDRAGPEKADIQKTRSEETLSVPSLVEAEAEYHRSYSHSYTEAVYDGSYTRYEYDCLALPPLLSPIGTRQEELSGSILVKKDSAILEECDDTRLRQDTLAAKSLAPISTTEYGPLVGGGGVAWRAPPLPPAPPLAPPPAPPAAPPRAPRAPHSHSASSLQLRAPPPAPRHPPLSDALFSSSTSELEKLKRNSSRILPALSRHRNREHLHLSDEGLHLHRAPPAPLAPPVPLAPLDPPAPAPPEPDQDPLRAEETGAGAGGVRDKKRVRCFACRKRLSIATLHTCRCGAALCAPHRYAEAHACVARLQQRARARAALHRDNPRVQAPKLPKI